MADPAREYGEGREPIQAVPEPTVVFMINRSLPRGEWTEDDVYRATRCGWVIPQHAMDRAVYAFGVSRGVVRGAFRIDRWVPADGERRWCFDGRPALEVDVIGKSMARFKPRRGDMNPVRLFMDGIPAAREDRR